MTLLGVAGAEVSSFVGAVVWWQLHGSIEMETLEEAWEFESLPEGLLPNRPSAERALKHTLRAHVSRRRILRPLGSGVRGYCLVNETAKGEELEHNPDLRAVLVDDPTGKGTRLVLTPSDHSLAQTVEQDFDGALSQIDPRAASTWLTQLVYSVKAVSLSARKGFYFVPSGELVQWRLIVSTIQDVSDHDFYFLPTAHVGEAVEAVLAAVTNEVDTLLRTIEDEIDHSDNLGRRALQNRVGVLEGALDKVGYYEQILGRELDEMRDRLGDLRGELAAAVLDTPEGTE